MAETSVGQQLGSIRAVIAHGPTLWPDVQFLDVEQLPEHEKNEFGGVGIPGERFVRVAPLVEWTESLPCAESYPARFWRELVEEWRPLFQEPGRYQPGITNFYAMYGGVTAFGVENWYESLEAARLAIEWLATVANFVRLLKNGAYGFLRQWFDKPVSGQDPVYYFHETIPGIDGPERLSFYYTPSLVLGRQEVNYIQPRDDEELASRAWTAVMDAAWDRLQKITLSPVLADFSKRTDATILWGFEPQGALNAAFLQFFFEELSHVNLPKCGADDCRNLVPPGRRKWCSERCRDRVKKQKKRKRDSIEA